MAVDGILAKGVEGGGVQVRSWSSSSDWVFKYIINNVWWWLSYSCSYPAVMQDWVNYTEQWRFARPQTEKCSVEFYLSEHYFFLKDTQGEFTHLQEHLLSFWAPWPIRSVLKKATLAVPDGCSANGIVHVSLFWAPHESQRLLSSGVECCFTQYRTQFNKRNSSAWKWRETHLESDI